MSDTVLHLMNRSRIKPSDGGEPPMSTLDKRVGNLERDVSTLQKDVAVIASNYATKEDVMAVRVDIKDVIISVEQKLATQTRWMIGTMIAIAGLSIAAAKLFF